MVKVEEDEKDDAEGKGNPDVSRLELPERHEPGAAVRSLKADFVDGKAHAGLVDRSAISAVP